MNFLAIYPKMVYKEGGACYERTKSGCGPD